MRKGVYDPRLNNEKHRYLRSRGLKHPEFSTSQIMDFLIGSIIMAQWFKLLALPRQKVDSTLLRSFA